MVATAQKQRVKLLRYFRCLRVYRLPFGAPIPKIAGKRSKYLLPYAALKYD